MTSAHVVDRDFAAEWFAQGFPWCDMCEQPAVRADHVGIVHLIGHGEELHPDTTGHQPSIARWLNRPADASHYPPSWGKRP